MVATILITGATGLIGFRILLSALAEGHNVRFTARSEEKAKTVLSNPAVSKLAPGSRLEAAIVPDLAAEGALDDALRGVTHVVHAGSPVPSEQTTDPAAQLFEPTVRMGAGLLASALAAPGVRRVVVTSSNAANFGQTTAPPPGTSRISSATRPPMPDPLPTTFDSGFQAYVMGKLVALLQAEEFVRTRNPHFSLAHVMPSYVYGRNELALSPEMMLTHNSSSTFAVMGMLGMELPYPLPGTAVHIDDIADLHLRVLFLDPETAEPQDFGVATQVDYSTIFDHVEKAFPKAVEEGIFKRGTVPTMVVEYESSDVEKLLGRKLKSFETAVVDIAGQYLELLGKEKA